jgi:acetyl-CoA C-acetyltransferase
MAVGGNDRGGHLAAQRRADVAGDGVDTGRLAGLVRVDGRDDQVGQRGEGAADEHIRPDVSEAALGRLKPAFRDGGTVTAGNASGMNDAAAAAVLLSEERARALGVPVRARLLADASGGVDPRYMGIGPVPAVRKVLDRAGARLEDVGVIELNEAFAAPGAGRHLRAGPGSGEGDPNGGAIALGHPIGATGTAITPRPSARWNAADTPTG